MLKKLQPPALLNRNQIGTAQSRGFCLQRHMLTTFHIATDVLPSRLMHLSVGTKGAETSEPLRGMTMQSSSHSLLSGADGFATKSADVLILIGRVLLAWVFVGVAYGAITNFAGSLAYFHVTETLPTRAVDVGGSLARTPNLGQFDIGHWHALRSNSGIRVCGGRYCDRTSLLGIPRRPAADRPVQ